MTWFLVALIGPILYAITNHIDKHLLEKYFSVSGVGTLLIFSSLASILALPIIFFADPTVLDVDPFNIFILCIVGLLNTALLWFYLMALEEEEASVTIVFYQLVPVFGAVLGYFLLDEVPTLIQLVAMAIVILGTTIISFELDGEGEVKLRTRTILFMTAASLCWALGSVIFKVAALEENVWRSLFWEHVTLEIVGLLIFALVPTYRKHFLESMRANSKKILSLNVLNEGLYMFGNGAVAFAYLMAPIAFVLLTQSLQPFFVLAIGIFLTTFFPALGREKMGGRHLAQKITAIVITGIGTYMLLHFGG
ncbi:DMT family transporter [Candidatus Kaiserbacteria bacterium]|nr:DMT family transporter [Candidatus Kaiserbacteria bacterium]USN88746.1 MAG: DMT family transporter [Candidatus Nomurabacteria bacterium]